MYHIWSQDSLIPSLENGNEARVKMDLHESCCMHNIFFCSQLNLKHLIKYDDHDILFVVM